MSNSTSFNHSGRENPNQNNIYLDIGDAVDLGRILSNVHPTSVHELPPRPILTSSDWITAWETAESAIKFAFPNRAAELRGYKKHILVLFGIKNVSEHHNIIRYDVAVRRYVEGGQRILLTEFNKFTHLHMAFLLPNGVEYLAPDLSGERGENRG